jgi:putative heme-binding domain-containing protein
LTDKQVGPSLEGIGKRETGKYLLQSIVDPQASIAPGYGVVSVELINGEMVSGMLMKDGRAAVS